jgi:probable F420-dependent oxidoreductase
VKFGLFAALAAPYVTPEGLAGLGQEAEERGIESLWVAEHVVLFDDYQPDYPYSPDGRFPATADSGLLEPLSTLAFLTAHTSTVRLGTGILLLPQRNPVYTAKEVANLDWLSGGRIDLGIGVGWQREEFAAVNVSWPERGRRTDEYLAVMKSLWTEDVSSFHGRFYDLRDARMYPKPVQDPHPPIHVGGESDAALRRAAALGDGWYTFNRLPEDVAPALARLDDLLEQHGRTRADVEISVCPYLHALTPEMVTAYGEAGVDRVIGLVFGGSRDDFAQGITALEPCLEAARG